jgi:hypothetical protein
MAGVLKDAQKNRMLDHLAGAVESGDPITHASLHTGYPAIDGNEVSGGSPAYARKAVTFAAAATGSVALNGTLPEFDVPAATTVAAVGFYDASTAGVIQADDNVTDEVFASQGTYTITAGTFTLSDP